MNIPMSAAAWVGISPRISVIFTSAPLLTNNSTTSSWPFYSKKLNIETDKFLWFFFDKLKLNYPVKRPSEVERTSCRLVHLHSLRVRSTILHYSQNLEGRSHIFELDTRVVQKSNSYSFKLPLFAANSNAVWPDIFVAFTSACFSINSLTTFS